MNERETRKVAAAIRESFMKLEAQIEEWRLKALEANRNLQSIQRLAYEIAEGNGRPVDLVKRCLRIMTTTSPKEIEEYENAQDQ